MPMIAIKVPDNMSGYLEAIKVPGKKSSASDMHITILYFENDLSLRQIAALTMIMSSVASELKPFEVKFDSISSFDKNNDKVPIICRVDSSGLMAVNTQLKRAFDLYGLQYSKTFPEYKPHITLSYNTEPYEAKLDEQLSFMATGLYLFCGEEMNDKLVSHFQFGE